MRRCGEKDLKTCLYGSIKLSVLSLSQQEALASKCSQLLSELLMGCSGAIKSFIH